MLFVVQISDVGALRLGCFLKELEKAIQIIQYYVIEKKKLEERKQGQLKVNKNTTK